MMKSFKVYAATVAFLTASAGAGHADSTTSINRNVLRQMVQLSVAFTQARISYTSPPFPVQFVSTSPFNPTARAQIPLGPLVSPSAGQPNNNFFIQEATHLAPGSYTVVATPGSYDITPTATGVTRTFPIPANVSAILPSKSVSGTVSVASASAIKGPVVVNYTLRR